MNSPLYKPYAVFFIEEFNPLIQWNMELENNNKLLREVAILIANKTANLRNRDRPAASCAIMARVLANQPLIGCPKELFAASLNLYPSRVEPYETLLMQDARGTKYTTNELIPTQFKPSIIPPTFRYLKANPLVHVAYKDHPLPLNSRVATPVSYFDTMILPNFRISHDYLTRQTSSIDTPPPTTEQIESTMLEITIPPSTASATNIGELPVQATPTTTIADSPASPVHQPTPMEEPEKSDPSVNDFLPMDRPTLVELTSVNPLLAIPDYRELTALQPTISPDAPSIDVVLEHNLDLFPQTSQSFEDIKKMILQDDNPQLSQLPPRDDESTVANFGSPPSILPDIILADSPVEPEPEKTPKAQIITSPSTTPSQSATTVELTPKTTDVQPPHLSPEPTKTPRRKAKRRLAFTANAIELARRDNISKARAILTSSDEISGDETHFVTSSPIAKRLPSTPHPKKETGSSSESSQSPPSALRRLQLAYEDVSSDELPMDTTGQLPPSVPLPDIRPPLSASLIDQSDAVALLNISTRTFSGLLPFEHNLSCTMSCTSTTIHAVNGYTNTIRVHCHNCAKTLDYEVNKVQPELTNFLNQVNNQSK